MLRVVAPPVSSPEELAREEALLLALDAGEGPEFLRIWELESPAVVLGRSSQIVREVDAAACGEDGVSILRRCSGGTSILAGPGCLMYSVGVSLERRPTLRSIDEAHRYVLDALAKSLAERLPGVARRGTSDLAWNDRKISGNSLRLLKEAVLYHGTLLYDLRPETIARYLKPDPPRQPEYRRGREHDEFVTTLPLSRSELLAAIDEAFPTAGDYGPLPDERIAQAMAERYGRDDWHLRR